MSPSIICRLVAILAALAFDSGAAAQGKLEREISLDMLDNGRGREKTDAPEGDARQFMVPWWTASGTPRTIPTGTRGLEIAAGATLAQPIAVFAPFAERLRITGRVEGSAILRLSDGRGQKLELDLRDQAFELSAALFTTRFGQAPMPRFLLELSAPSTSPGARFVELHAVAPWPCPTETALASELLGLCDGVIRTWLARGIDRDGSRSTSFMTTRFDVVTGERVDSGSGGLHPLFESLLDLCVLSNEPAWHTALETYLEDYFSLGFHPVSGLPREWDGLSDLPLDLQPVEVGRAMTFLLDLSERGPLEFRERALRQVEAMAATILERGQLPDGSLAVKYVPADGTPNLDVPPIRRLDVAAPLARLSRKNGDARLIEAARVALAALEFTHFWGGTWAAIDPDFDDSYGHWGNRAATMLAAFPGDSEFRRFNASAFAHFAPLWHDALRFGGVMASDQNRCWELLDRYAQVDPTIRKSLDRSC
ncbi:MAG: hypothetical protein ABI054_06220, partial [Planctomycetota bacterium]